MRYFSNKSRYKTVVKKGFSLVEVVAAMTILALTATGIVHVINSSIDNAVNLDLKMQALEVARDNMENLLSLNSVQNSTDYGTSEVYPKIDWTTTVESFYEPITDGMWVQAVCAAEYTDTTGEFQSVELTHWITSLTKIQMKQMLENEGDETYDREKTFCGKTLAEIMAMPFDELWAFIESCPEILDALS